MSLTSFSPRTRLQVYFRWYEVNRSRGRSPAAGGRPDWSEPPARGRAGASRPSTRHCSPRPAPSAHSRGPAGLARTARPATAYQSPCSHHRRTARRRLGYHEPRQLLSHSLPQIKGPELRIAPAISTRQLMIGPTARPCPHETRHGRS